MGKYFSSENAIRYWNNTKNWVMDLFVAKVEGKGLSTEDYTTAEKDKLADLHNTTVDSALSSTSTNPVQNKTINTALSGKVPTTRKVNNKALSVDINLTAADVAAIPAAQKGAASGVAELDASGKVPAAQLPSYVDDVLEYSAKSNFPATGETGKIYVSTNDNKTYRWSGSAYVEISASIALGETASTAYPGNKGKIAYDHSQAAHAPANAEQNVQSDWSVTDTSSDAYIKGKPTSMPANGGNAATVGGHTVEKDVPANAVFTDTKPVAMKGATASAAGAAGYVPAPPAGSQTKFLRADGTYQTPANTTYSAFKGATSSAAGGSGLVPAPATGKQNGLLCGDGTWAEPLTDAEIDAICVV